MNGALILPEPTSLKSFVPVDMNVGTLTPFQGSGGINATNLCSGLSSVKCALSRRAAHRKQKLETEVSGQKQEQQELGRISTMDRVRASLKGKSPTSPDTQTGMEESLPAVDSAEGGVEQEQEELAGNKV